MLYFLPYYYATHNNTRPTHQLVYVPPVPHLHSHDDSSEQILSDQHNHPSPGYSIASYPNSLPSSPIMATPPDWPHAIPHPHPTFESDDVDPARIPYKSRRCSIAADHNCVLRSYELTVRQQPVHARTCGPGDNGESYHLLRGQVPLHLA